MDKATNFSKDKKPSCYTQTGKTAYLRELPKHLLKDKGLVK